MTIFAPRDVSPEAVGCLVVLVLEPETPLERDLAEVCMRAALALPHAPKVHVWRVTL